jgi:hypothetical protein
MIRTNQVCVRESIIVAPSPNPTAGRRFRIICICHPRSPSGQLEIERATCPKVSPRR